MSREIELRRLPLSDRSALIATNLRIIHDRDNGVFGEERTSIRREAIASVQVGWRRSEGLLLTGIVLLGIWLFMWMGSVLTSQGPGAAESQSAEAAAEEGFSVDQAFQAVGRLFSSSFLSVVKYGALLAGVGMFVTFWFYRLTEVQISGAGATIKGYPTTYEEGCKFCDFLFSLQQAAPIALAKEEPASKAAKEEKPVRQEKTADEQKPPDKEWRF